ncbi:MAG: hypothetical protein V7731_04545 [Amphritea sp.]
MASMQFKKLLRAYKTVNFLMGILFLYGSSVVSAAGLPESKVVSLSHNPDSSDLIVAYSQALYRLDTETQEWLSISLPAEVERVTAVVAKAGSPQAIYLAAPGAGVLHSVDGGKSWDLRNEGLPSKEVSGLIRHAKQPDTLYAVIPETGIFRSENAGGDWQLMHAGPENMTDIIVHSDMPDSMQTGWIFAATKAGVSRSMDCFCLWREAGSLAGEITGLTYDPKQPAQIYAATDKGVFHSQDGGENWDPVGGLKLDVTALLVTTSGDLYAGTRTGELFKAVDRSKRWEQLDGF